MWYNEWRRGDAFNVSQVGCMQRSAAEMQEMQEMQEEMQQEMQDRNGIEVRGMESKRSYESGNERKQEWEREAEAEGRAAMRAVSRRLQSFVSFP